MAVIFGLITVILVSAYLGSLDGTARDDSPHIEVVVAKGNIAPFTLIEEDMLAFASLPVAAVHPDAVLQMAEIVGKVTRAEIVEGEQVLAGRVFMDLSRTVFSYSVPDGMRAIAIPVTNVSGVSGFIVPGDRVDVLVSYSGREWGDETVTYTIFQNIQVLAAGGSYRETEETDTEAARAGTGSVQTVVLAVKPAQAEVLAFATLEGSFHLTLRFPTDADKVAPSSYSIENFMTYGDR